jgi:hypothetical protein
MLWSRCHGVGDRLATTIVMHALGWPGRLSRLGPCAAASRWSRQPPPSPGPGRAMAALAGVRSESTSGSAARRLTGDFRLMIAD